NEMFAVTTFEIKDRYILDGLVRRDESSLFGSNQRTAVYQRVSAAYRVSEDLHLPGVDEFKLRVSSGTAGLRPPFEAQYEVFSLEAGNPATQTLGNKTLRPAGRQHSDVLHQARRAARRDVWLEVDSDRGPAPGDDQGRQALRYDAGLCEKRRGILRPGVDLSHRRRVSHQGVAL